MKEKERITEIIQNMHLGEQKSGDEGRFKM